MGRKRRRGLGIGDGIVALLIVVLIAWAASPAFRTTIDAAWAQIPFPGAHPHTRSLPDSEHARQLQALPIRTDEDEYQIPRYDRQAFGQTWADEDHNGCDTRNDVLARDLARPTFKEGTNGCVILSGTLAEPYTGTIVEFQRGQDTSALVQIDHVVALSDAWKSGAWQWDAPTRQRFANDQDNLLAVDGQANQDKEAASADEWLPPNEGFHCDYIKRQISVKTQWGLSVTEKERDAMVEILMSCE